MGETLETAIIFPALLVLLLLLLLFAPLIFIRTDQMAREGIGDARTWTENSRMYEFRPRANWVTQPERLAQVLDCAEDIAHRVQRGKP